MSRYRIAIIGAGRIAGVHALSVSRNPRLELVAIVDPSGGGSLPSESGVPCFADLNAAMNGARPDALVVASPTATHVDYILQACKLGLPVLCEKPVAFQREPIVDVISRVAKAKLPVILGFHRRFDPYRCEMRDRVARGEVGKIEHILQFSRDPRIAEAAAVSHQGSMIADMVVHDLDELIWFVDRLPDRAQASLSQNVDSDTPGPADTVNILLHWNRGAVAHVSATRRAAHAFEQRLEIFGSEGRLICGDPQTSPVIVDLAQDTRIARRHEHFWDRYRLAYQAEIDHLADILATGAQPRCTLDDGLRAHDLVTIVRAVADDLPADGKGTH